jgi:general secretion pathway protein A
MDEKNKALRQRIAVHYNIEPLTESETRDYIKHRLSIARSDEEIFTPEAFHEIYSFSEGYPRLINTICDRMLLSGYVLDKIQIDARIAKKCSDELTLPGERENARNANQEDLEVNLTEQTPFTWNPDPDAEQQEIKLDESAINTIQNQPKRVFPIVIVVFAIWIATVLSFYNWFFL